MKIQNWIRSGYVTYIGIALLSFVRRVSRLGSLVFPYRDYSISITLHTISFSTPNSGLYSEIQDIFILKSTTKEGNFTAGVRALFIVPVEKIQGYTIASMNAYFNYPSNIACTGIYERTNDIAVAYQCFSSCSATCAVTMLFIKKDIIGKG